MLKIINTQFEKEYGKKEGNFTCVPISRKCHSFWPWLTLGKC